MTDTQQGTNGGGDQPVAQQQTQAVAPRKMTPMPIPMTGGAMQPRNLPEAIELAKLIAHSGLAPEAFRGDVGGVIIAMQMGAELGLSPMASIQNIAVINGRPSLWGDAMLALVSQHQDFVDIVEEFDEKSFTAKCTVKRKNRTPTVRTFSKTDAETAGLWNKKGPWQTYPKRMCQQRARGFALRDSFADALRGFITAEEAGDVVTLAPEWRESSIGDTPGTVHFGGPPAQKQPAPAAAEEPAHDPVTGEVKTAPAEQPPAKQEQPKQEALKLDGGASGKKVDY